jgi:hypothetical protein
VGLFSGETFEDMVASLTWPYTLPSGWLVEWDTSSANDDNAEYVMYGLHYDILYRH